MKTTNEYGTAIGYMVSKPNFIPKGEYKPAELDEQKKRADMLLQSIDGSYYTLKLNRPIEIKGRGVKKYGNNIIAVTERIYNQLQQQYRVMCDF
ncbi:MAG: hypothetical protein NC209_03975 [Alistipes sp.]|nr:hypothetical protein [Lachnospiraceae bacterium]MCM1250289.1 hypothetical protein [Alistipes sp.]